MIGTESQTPCPSLPLSEQKRSKGQAEQSMFPAEAAELLRSCVHCGLCLGACPTYRENGNENDSPRGRLYLMKGLSDRRLEPTETVLQHLDLCLNCRACETACPSGVHYGRILETTRATFEPQRPKVWWEPLLRRFMFDHLFARPELMAMAVRAVRFMQTSGIRKGLHGMGLIRMLPRRLQELEAMQPIIREPAFRANAPKVFPALGGRPVRRVAFFSGCVMDQMMGEIHRATIKVLQAHGVEVLTVHGQSCCGALMFHAGETRSGRAVAKKNLEIFRGLRVDAIVNNSAGCGSTLKEYGDLLPDLPEAKEFSRLTRDVSEILQGLESRIPFNPVEATVCYDAPCHLHHAQRITDAPLSILSRIPGLSWKLLPDAEFCCGAAGIYNLTQPEMSSQILARKIEALRQTGARIVLTGNPGCILQIRHGCRKAGLPCEVLHPMELLARALPTQAPQI